MLTPNIIDLGLCGVSGSTQTFYIPAYTRFTIKEIVALSNAANDAETATVTIKDPSGNSVCVATFSSTVGAAGVGVLATSALNATYGSSVFGPDETTNTYFEVEISDETANNYCYVQIVINPGAQTASDFS